jgi:hypothetical protein
MSRRLATIAREINEHCSGITAKIVQGYCDTDRKIGRLRVPGKGRYGNRIIIHDDATGRVLFDHNAAETYRCNAEVEYWLADWKRRKGR